MMMFLGMSWYFEIYVLLHEITLNWLKQESQLERSSGKFQWVNESMGQSSHLLAFRDLFNTGRSLDLNMQTLKNNGIFKDLLAKMDETLNWFIQYCSLFFLKLFFINNCTSRNWCITIYIIEVLVTPKRTFSGTQFPIRYI